MLAAARGRREVVARDGDEGGDNDGSEVAYTPPETPASARAAEERIYAASRDAAYKVQLDTFKAEMSKVTALDVHERLWTSLTHDGFMERPATLAARMHRAHAKVRTSTTHDLNRRFLSRVLEPWASVPALRIRRQRLVEDRLDLETGCTLSQLSRDRCVDRIGHMTRIVEEIEQEQRESEADDALALERVAHMAGDSDRTMLRAALSSTQPYDVEVREGREGRNVNGQFRPRCEECAALHIPDPYHAQRSCPLRARDRKVLQNAREGRAAAGHATHAGYESPEESHAAHAHAGQGSGPQWRGGASRQQQYQSEESRRSECCNCQKADAGHTSYTQCPQPLNQRLRKRLSYRPMDLQRRTAFLAKLQKPNLDKQQPPGAAHAGDAHADGQPDGEGKHSRKQRNGRSRQPKHKGAVMHAAGGESPEHESWEDAYYLGTEDGTTMVAIRAVEHAAEEEGSHCGGEAVAARLSTLLYGVKGRSGRKSRAAIAAAPPSAVQPQAPAATRRLGRPRVLPPGIANDQGARMERPGWSETRERLAHRPRGFEPDFSTPGSAPASFGPPLSDEQVMDRSQLDVRQQQLLHAWRNALEHLTCPNVNMKMLCEGGNAAAAAATRWRTALSEVLNGYVDRRDEYHVACEAALARAVKRVLASAPLTLTDFRYQDMSAVLRHAVRSVLGIHLDPYVPSPIGPPQPQPYSLSTDADAPAATAATTAAANGDPCGQVITLRVLPLAARQHLARDDAALVQRRAEQAEYYTRKAQLGFDRPGTALIDMAHTALHLADMPISAALVDTGCDIAGISRPFYQRLCKEQGIQPSIGHVRMRGIVPGVSQCDMVVEPLPLTFNRGTTWEISLPWPRWVILDNPALPDVLLDTSVVRALSLTILSDGTACYLLDVARGLHGPQAVVPFRTLGTDVESLHLEVADLDAIGALPHCDPNKCYVFPLDAAGGKAGAVRAISGYSGMGTVSFRMVEGGVHFENLQLIEANEERKQLQLMHDLWPERLPDKVMQRAFDLGDAVGHDITQLTAEHYYADSLLVDKHVH
eukprot:jgi/Tetstr1/455125/TSEL_041977.t1